MSLYKPNNFGYRDNLPESHPEKIIKGVDFDVEFEAIARAIAGLDFDIQADENNSWIVVDYTGYTCKSNQSYLVNIPTANPYINLPRLAAGDAGKWVLISDGGDGWSSNSNALVVNLNGPLQGQNVNQLALDLANVHVTFVWDGSSWWVYSSMSSTGVDEHIADAPQDGKIYCRQDGTWVLLPPEEDPTVPDHVKGITQADIDRWNAGGSGGGGTATSIDWDNVFNKPQPIKDLAAENTPKVSILSGGNY